MFSSLTACGKKLFGNLEEIGSEYLPHPPLSVKVFNGRKTWPSNVLGHLHHLLQCFPVQGGAVSISASDAAGQDALYDASFKAGCERAYWLSSGTWSCALFPLWYHWWAVGSKVPASFEVHNHLFCLVFIHLNMADFFFGPTLARWGTKPVVHPGKTLAPDCQRSFQAWANVVPTGLTGLCHLYIHLVIIQSMLAKCWVRLTVFLPH